MPPTTTPPLLLIGFFSWVIFLHAIVQKLRRPRNLHNETESVRYSINDKIEGIFFLLPRSRQREDRILYFIQQYQFLISHILQRIHSNQKKKKKDIRGEITSEKASNAEGSPGAAEGCGRSNIDLSRSEG